MKLHFPTSFPARERPAANPAEGSEDSLELPQFLPDGDPRPAPDQQEEVLDLPVIFDEEIPNQRSHSEEALEMPSFLPDTDLRPALDQHEEILDLPVIFDAETPKQHSHNEEALETPSFLLLDAPSSTNQDEALFPTVSFSTLDSPLIKHEEETPLRSPVFLPLSLPKQIQENSEVELDKPIFNLSETPLRSQDLENPVELPTFVSFVLPKSKMVEESNLISPQFVSFTMPQQEGPLEENPLTTPLFPKIALPRPSNSPPEATLKNPEFPSFEIPSPRGTDIQGIPLPPNNNDLNPIIRDFDHLAHSSSYEEIVKKALLFGSIGDKRMLFANSPLKNRYLNNLFEDLLAEAPLLLERSSASQFGLENDQEQIDLFCQFCTDLIKVQTWDDLKLESLLIKRLKDTQLENEALTRKGLIQFKDFIFCYLTELMFQEQNENQKFGAIKKDLSKLEKALSALRQHIEANLYEDEVALLREAEKVDFASWEERDPLPYSTARLDPPQVNPDKPSISRNLAAIQGDKPKAAQLNDFTDQVLILPDSGEKVGYFLELAKAYFKLPTVTALEKAVSWVDLALTTLKPIKESNQELWLACYELRGAIWLKMSQTTKNQDPLNEFLPKKWLDYSYKDFHFSVDWQNGKENNFVRTVKKAKEAKSLDEALKGFQEAIKVDEHYGESHYHLFLKQFEQSHLKSPNLLHPQFNGLIGNSPLKALESLLRDKVHQRRETLFKITCSCGSFYLKTTPEGISISHAGTHILNYMLMHGIKDVQAVSGKERVYLGTRISKEDFAKLVSSFKDYNSRLTEIEKGINAFHAFELAALHKLSAKDDKDSLSNDIVREKLRKPLRTQLIDLHVMAMRSYTHFGRLQNKSPKHQEYYTAALLHACHAISECDRLLNTQEDKVFKRKKLDLLIKKATLYKEMGLTNSYASALQEAISFGKKDDLRYLDCSLHYSLGLALINLNKKEEALEQFYQVASSKKQAKSKPIIKKAEQQIWALQKVKEAEKAPKPVDDVFAEFQDDNIREECLQILRDHYQANANIHLHRTVPLWDEFFKKAVEAESLKEFCEVIFSSVLIGEKVQTKKLAQLARLSNLELKDTSTLDQIKGYLLDALKTYREEKAREEDKLIAKLEKAEAAVARAEAFHQLKQELTEKLKQGEKIRPGSQSRQKVTHLASQLQGISLEKSDLLRMLGELIDRDITEEVDIVEEDLSEILGNALNIETNPPKIQDNVLQIFGNNIFLSQIKDKIERELRTSSNIHDIHLMGTAIYVDCSLKWPGINLAIGGQYVEFILDKGRDGKLNPPQKLTIDLAGVNGKNGDVHASNKAADGWSNNPNGTKGADGNNAQGGQPGGDFCINAKEPLVGLTKAFVEQINLKGGAGGLGSNGQAGGTGIDAIKGADARTDIKDGDPSDTCWGHIDMRRGGRATQGGSGGEGGHGGAGGIGGESGQLLFEGAPDELFAKGNGDNGADGDPGAGGKGGAGQPDGFDYVIVKGGLTDGQDKVSGYRLHCIDSSNDRKGRNWKDGISKEETINQSKGLTKDKAKTAEERNAIRNKQTKHDLKKELFNSSLARHLHAELPGNKKYAFQEVVDQRAKAHEKAKAAKQELAAKQRKLKDIDALFERSANMLKQAQTQVGAKIQHSRLATFSGGPKSDDVKKELLPFFKSVKKDQANKLPFQECSPIFHAKGPFVPHALELAMHVVNKSKGENCAALANLVEEIAKLPVFNLDSAVRDDNAMQDFESESLLIGGEHSQKVKAPPIKSDYGSKDCVELSSPTAESRFNLKKKQQLINKTALLIEQLPPKSTVGHYDKLLSAANMLQEDSDLPLRKVVEQKMCEAETFAAVLEKEQTALFTAFKTVDNEESIKLGILHFLYRDRLFFRFLAKEKDPQKIEKFSTWFEDRLKEKIHTFYVKIYQAEPSQDSLEPFLSYSKRIKNDIHTAITQNDKFNPKGVFKKSLLAERKAIHDKLKMLREEERWISNHLPDLAEEKISILKLLEDGTPLEKLYLECSKLWVNIPSREKATLNNNAKENKPNISQCAEWVRAIAKADWKPARMLQLEKQIAKLADLKEKIGDPEPFVKKLAKLYDSQQDELAEIFVSKVSEVHENAASADLVDQLCQLSLNDLFFYRTQYRSKLESESPPPTVSESLIYIYLQRKHIQLSKKEILPQWLKSLPPFKEEKDKANAENTLDELILKANNLYQFNLFLPAVDFLNLIRSVILQGKLDGRNFYHDLLKKSVHDILGETDLKEVNPLLDQLKQVPDAAKFHAIVFLLLNLELSYDQTIHVIKALEKRKDEKGFEIAKALALFQNKAAIQQVVFQSDWEEALLQARLYDQVSQQLKSNTGSIEKLLLEMAEESQLLSVEEQTDLLSKIISILKENGNFTSHRQLKFLQNQLIIKLASVDDVDYQSALLKAYETTDREPKELPALLLKTLESAKPTSAQLPVILIAIKHFPFQTEELKRLDRVVNKVKDDSLDERSMAQKKACRQQIRLSVIHHLRHIERDFFQNQSTLKDTLAKQQQEALLKINTILESSQILHQSRHLARFSLWLKSLDHHYEIDAPGTDAKGEKRKELYAQALEKFINGLKGDDSEKGMSEFNQWLLTTHNQLKQKTATTEELKSILKKLEKEGPEKNAAKQQLKTLIWQGMLPYYKENEGDCIVSLSEGIKLDEESVVLLRLKFDEAMIQEEIYQFKCETESIDKTFKTTWLKWRSNLEEWLCSERCTSRKLRTLYPTEEEILKGLNEGELPEVDLPKKAEKKVIEEEEYSFLEEYIRAAKKKKKDPSALFQKAFDLIAKFLLDLEFRIEENQTTTRDSTLLKNLKEVVQDSKAKDLPVIQQKIQELELQLITTADKQESDNKALLLEFFNSLRKVNRIPKDPDNAFTISFEEDIKQLEKNLDACRAFLGEEHCLAYVHNIKQFLSKNSEPLHPKMLAHIFWVLPRLNDPTFFIEVMEERLPENWAATVLERHCLEAMLPSLSEISTSLPNVNLNGKSEDDKDQWVKTALQNSRLTCQESSEKFKNSVQNLGKTTHLKYGEKELLLRLIAEHLTLRNKGELGFSIEAYIHLLDNYMMAPNVLEKISQEITRPNSLITEHLFQPSFESFKYALTLAWIAGKLEPGILQLAETQRQKLADALIQIETTKKEEMMRSVVEALNLQTAIGDDKVMQDFESELLTTAGEHSQKVKAPAVESDYGSKDCVNLPSPTAVWRLKGRLMTPAVVECVSHFAQGILELDTTTVAHLKNRTDSGEWYQAIQDHTKAKRSKPRDLKTLIDLMKDESDGINDSIKNLLIGEHPQLMKDIEDIKQEYDSIKHWKEADILDWVQNNRGSEFSKNSQNLKRGIAITSRAREILENFPMRNTQLIAIWLMLGNASSEEKGKICQMSTGEGKSSVFSALAVLKAMDNIPVDVVTTSPLLAERDAINKKPFFDLFGMTVSNNCDTEAEQSEEERKSRYFRNGKIVDIVYGDVGSFERDLLLTEFHGKEIIHKARLDGKKAILVDEVDGLFLDSAGMVLYLSHSVDTLRFLERIFVEVWSVANMPAFQNALPFHDKAVEQIAKVVNAKIDSGEIQLPGFEVSEARYMEMKAVVNRKLTLWIRSALYAKVLRVNNEYIVSDDIVNGKKKKVVTVMDKGTGVEQMSLKWSNGLHQFLQFKHGLELSPDSLKAVFLSNYFFFKRYGQYIYGLSGTLGSDTEQKYLKDLYQVNLGKLPRFKAERYIQYEPYVAGDDLEWLAKINESVRHEIKERKRAILILCDSIEDALTIEKQLKNEHPVVHTFTNSQNIPPFLAHDNPKKLGPGDIIVATNLAGRGNDPQTSSRLEANAGLHVLSTFLPPNVRIEEQNFKRTARAGNEGSGQFIIKDTERRPFNELCRLRDLAEKQRLESVAQREVKKIEFEHELLRGFSHNGVHIEGFQSLLEWVKTKIAGEERFVQEAQLNSLKNRWAFWIDHADEKISLVHAIGKEGVIDSFVKFKNGVIKDIERGPFRLVKEPIELIKLGSEFRQKKMWSQAKACYEEAAKDPQYQYALYYKAACQFILSPSASHEDKKAFKKDAKTAARSIKKEMDHLQTALQNIPALLEERRISTGEADYGNPYKARSEEKLQIWSIFLSAIDGALGGTLGEEAFKKSPFIKGNEAGAILEHRIGSYKRTRLSAKMKIEGKSVSKNGKTIPVPAMYDHVLAKLKDSLTGGRDKRNITKESLRKLCKVITTQDSARTLLGCKEKVFYKCLPIPASFQGWPQKEAYTESSKFVMSSIFDTLQGQVFDSKEAIKAAFKEKKKAHPLLEQIDENEVFTALDQGKLFGKDYALDLLGKVIQNPPKTSNSPDDLKDGLTQRYHDLQDEHLKRALYNACREKTVKDQKVIWSLKPTIYLSDLCLPSSTDEASDTLWTLLEDQELIKPPKVQQTQEEWKKRSDKIKDDLEKFFNQSLQGKDKEKVDDAVKSVFNIIDSSVGMVYKLDNKKTTAEFAEIIRKYYHDHRQHAPAGLQFFIDLGLEVIVDLIEKKDPPAWYETLAVTVMGVIQIVAGVIIKAYVPVVGELIGNALISTGMDDVMFAITSAINGQFSWDDYAAHKGESLKRSIISSAICCGISFGVNVAQVGASEAWRVQQMSGVEKLAEASKTAVQAGKAASDSFNLGTHIIKEVGRSFLNMGINQVVSRGLEGMTKLIASSYDEKIKQGIAKAVNDHWHLVQEQATALYDKLGGDELTKGNIDECIQLSMRRIQESSFFDGVIRGSKQAVPQAATLIGDKGWGTFISYAPDIAKMGVSIPKLVSLVEDNVHQFAREVRETKERKEAITNSAKKISKDAFNKDLEEKKKKYTEQLTEAFNSVLNSGVFAPLVSAGTQYLSQKCRDLIMPLSDQEQIAQSAKLLSKIHKTEMDTDKAFFDDTFRALKDANVEVGDLSEDELQKKPVGFGESIATLKKEYGDLLKVYKDDDGNLYAQRPSRNDYAHGVEGGKAAGDPEIIAITKLVHANIAIKTPDGNLKTYSEDGKITISALPSHGGAKEPNTIYMQLDAKEGGGIGHVTLEGSKTPAGYTANDCLYQAVKESGRFDGDVSDLRHQTAETLAQDEGCKRFYHDWSLSSETKQFVGESPIVLGNHRFGFFQASEPSPFNLGLDYGFGSHDKKPTLFDDSFTGQFDLPGNFFEQPTNNDFSWTDFSLGFAKGLPVGAGESVGGFLSLGFSLATHPIDTSKQMLESISHLVELVGTAQWKELRETLAPEICDLVENWDKYSSEERGKILGRAVGEYGTNIFIPSATLKVASKGLPGAKKLLGIAKKFRTDYIEKTTKRSVLNGNSIWTHGKKPPVKNAFRHWKDHGHEFPELYNSKQYVEKAHQLYRDKSVLSRIRPDDGAHLRYDRLTNTFGSFTPEGVPKTMLKPGVSKPLPSKYKTPMDYFYGQ